MFDWSQAFGYQSHYHGMKSFISFGVGKSLISLLVNFFTEMEIKVKWNKVFINVLSVTGGGPQGGTAGSILQYLSHTSNNLNSLAQDEGFKFIDDVLQTFVSCCNFCLEDFANLMFNYKKNMPHMFHFLNYGYTRGL